VRLVILWAFALLLPAVPAAALSADLNRDGVVDFDDFFLFGDQFGHTGPVEVSDTVVVTRTDTVVVSRIDTLHRIDTLYIAPADTLTRSGSPISFGDPALEFAVRAIVGVDEGDLLSGDVDDITSLNLTDLNISLLDGLQHFTSLKTLSLTGNLIVDVGPLQELASLTTVTLADNRVRDIAPLAANQWLASGTSVLLAGNPLSALSRTTHVRTLQDRGVTVTADAFVVTFTDSLLEVAVRAALQQPTGDLLHLDLETITTFDVASDSITNLSGMEFMRGLVSLDLRSNQITSIAPLASLSKLQVLDLSNNAIGSFSPLAGLTALRDLDLASTGLTSVTDLANLRLLEKLSLNLNALDNIAGLSALTAMRQLNLRDNSIADLSVMLAMNALTDAWLESNPLDSQSRDTVIPALIDRGVFVRL
jgi:Leucine-rich repeat (LRR) protein